MATPTVASGNGPTGIAVSPNGQFVYVANYNTDGTGGISQYTVGPGGALTPMATPTVAAGHNPEGITVSPNGQYAYVANNRRDWVRWGVAVHGRGGRRARADGDADGRGRQRTAEASR